MGQAGFPEQTLGNGDKWQPNQWMLAGLNQALASSQANYPGTTVDPRTFARWASYGQFPNLNTKGAPPLQGGGMLGTNPGGASGAQGAGGALGGTTGLAGTGEYAGVHSAPGSLVPGNKPGTSAPGTGVPQGGIGSAGAGYTPAGQDANSLLNYTKQNYGAANQGNGQYGVGSFRFSDQQAQGNPMAAQFNKLMQSGDTATAYSMLMNDNTGVGKQMLQSAFAGAPDQSLFHQIVNTYSGGGTNAYGLGSSYDPLARLTGGHFDPSGNFQGGMTQAQLLAGSPATTGMGRGQIKGLIHQANAGAKKNG